MKVDVDIEPFLDEIDAELRICDALVVEGDPWNLSF
jgi:hypothetical protein